MTLSRRDFLRAGLATAGGLVIARPLAGALAGPLGSTALDATSRASRLFPGIALAHADLHNHSLHSDGDGDAALAFGLMRDAGLDIAALTDHSALQWGLPQDACLANKDCKSVAGIDENTWAAAAELAQAASEEGAFVAIRGFEWSSATVGHMNVWFSRRWIDPLHTGGASTGEGAGQFAHDEASFPAEQMALLDEIVHAAPTTGVTMAPFYAWLGADPSTPGIGGGADGIAGFNHPGREPGRFSNFKRLLGAPSNIVSIEVFNRREDYLFEGTDSIAQSPINECLNAGWRVGLTGVTDEHGTDWGTPLGKGRTGLWLTELSEAGVREAMLARRFFATRERGLRVDAAANGVQMGQTLEPGTVTFELDIDRGPAWVGKELLVQVLRSGTRMPEVQTTVPVVVPSVDEPVISFEVDVSAADGSWVVLRISDPADAPDERADAQWAAYGRGIAYCSPFFVG